jgi:hypothetical protein
LDKRAYLERNPKKPDSSNDNDVHNIFYTKDVIIEKMNTRCCVRRCKRGYRWANDAYQSIYGCDIDGLCRQCKTERNRGTILPKKEFPVIPYQGRTTAGRTASFEYQEDLDNYLKITR